MKYYENTSLMQDNPAGDVEDNPESQSKTLLQNRVLLQTDLYRSCLLYIKGFWILNATNNPPDFCTSLGMG